MERLDRFLNNVLSIGRKAVRNIIKDGRITVNGKCITTPEYKIDLENDSVLFDGKVLNYTRFAYYMMNKPAGYITALEDRMQHTIAELIPSELLSKGVVPVGRLDKDTTGLLILTNDGQFTHRLISPKSHISKVYEVEYEGELCDNTKELFHKGITLLDGTVCRPADIIINNNGNCTVTVSEGKYHQVKRMIAAVGGSVFRLHRSQIGDVFLDVSLEPGHIRPLSKEELCILMREK